MHIWIITDFRFCGGRLMRFSESKSTLPFNTIRPSSGVSIPAIHLSVMLLPLPEAPRMPMTPPSVLSDTSSEKPENLFLIAACRLIARLPSVHPLPCPQTVPPKPLHPDRPLPHCYLSFYDCCFRAYPAATAHSSARRPGRKSPR